MTTRLTIAGAAPDSENLGVSALLYATLQGLARRMPIFPTVLGFSRGCRPARFTLSDSLLDGEVCGATRSKRLYSSSNLDVAVTAASFWSGIHPLSGRVARSAAFLDVTGGDSFTDLYGQNRFRAGCQRKRLALNCGVPLILLPQTYGPFSDPSNLRVASDLVRRADSCWARDEHSFALLQQMLGSDFDPERHRCGVDLAFGLEPRSASDLIGPDLQRMLESERADTPLVGFNVSGLIYNDPELAVSRYRFKADYRAVLARFLSWLLDATPANLLLVPHVMSAPEHYESDPGACHEVAASLTERFAGRVAIAPDSVDQSQAKWLIAQTDWFCGTRMHSTIAGLSSGVPTATVSYSDKAKGVFESCEQGDQVIDPRQLGTEEVVDRLRVSYESREALRVSLSEHLPAVKQRASDQMDAIAERVLAASRRRDKAAG